MEQNSMSFRWAPLDTKTQVGNRGKVIADIEREKA